MKQKQETSRRNVVVRLLFLTLLIAGGLLFVQAGPIEEAGGSENQGLHSSLSKSGDKANSCSLKIKKNCQNGRVSIMVIQTGKPPENCDTEITLKEKGGNEIKTDDPKLTAIVDDDRDKTLIAENCCGKEEIEIDKNECFVCPEVITIEGPDKIRVINPVTLTVKAKDGSIPEDCEVEFSSGSDAATLEDTGDKEVKVKVKPMVSFSKAEISATLTGCTCSATASKNLKLCDIIELQNQLAKVEGKRGQLRNELNRIDGKRKDVRRRRDECIERKTSSVRALKGIAECLGVTGFTATAIGNLVAENGVRGAFNAIVSKAGLGTAAALGILCAGLSIDKTLRRINCQKFTDKLNNLNSERNNLIQELSKIRNKKRELMSKINECK